VWAACLIIGLFVIPSGRWTIDDGVKQIAAQQAKRFPPLVVVDGEVRSGLDDPAKFAPLAEPFARRVNGGFALGFSPLTRLLFDLWSVGGDWLLKLFPVLIGLLLWFVLARCGIDYGFLLLPLTFYSLVPWEHSLAWLLAWPACWMVLLRSEESRREALLLGGIGLAFAAALRPETVVLAGLLIFYLFSRKRHSAGMILLGSTGVVLSVLAVLFKFAADSVMIQVALNYASFDFTSWFTALPATVYNLLISCDRDLGISLFLAALLIAGTVLIRVAETKQQQKLLATGAVLFGLFFLIYAFRVWSHPLPPLALLSSGSFLAALPWVLLLAFPPYRERPALMLGLAAIAIGLLFVPISQGVHWGPRLLLFALPLLVIDLYKSGRAKGWLFSALLLLTLAQTAGAAVLVYARATESTHHARLLEPKLGNIVICPTRSQCIDLAPLWTGREFFVTASKREFRQLLIEFHQQKIDTVWTHLDVFDPLYVETFPDELYPNPKPVWPYRMTIVQAGNLYISRWRVYELVLNHENPGWGNVLNEEAGFLMGERSWDGARDLEREAVKLLPEDAEIRSNYALTLAETGERDEAIYQARVATELNPELPAPRALLERLQADQKMNSEAPSRP
jgi:hypothetical protein